MPSGRAEEEVVRAPIDAGAPINVERKDGFTPLHWAAYQGYLEIANMLLDAGAQVNALASGTTPLYWAFAWKRDDVAIALIERRARPPWCLATSFPALLNGTYPR